MDIDQSSFVLNITSRIELKPSDPEDYLTEYNVDILEIINNAGDTEVVGKVRFYKSANLYAVEFSLYDILDTSQELTELLDLFDFEDGPSKAFSEKVGLDIHFSHILYLCAIEILPEYRKIGLTELVTQRIIDTFVEDEGTVLVLLKAHPMTCTLWSDSQGDDSGNWSNRMEYMKMPKDKNEAQKKLYQKYQSKLGFEWTGVGSIMYRLRQ